MRETAAKSAPLVLFENIDGVKFGWILNVVPALRSSYYKTDDLPLLIFGDRIKRLPGRIAQTARPHVFALLV